MTGGTRSGVAAAVAPKPQKRRHRGVSLRRVGLVFVASAAFRPACSGQSFVSSRAPFGNPIAKLCATSAVETVANTGDSSRNAAAKSFGSD